MQGFEQALGLLGSGTQQTDDMDDRFSDEDLDSYYDCSESSSEVRRALSKQGLFLANTAVAGIQFSTDKAIIML